MSSNKWHKEKKWLREKLGSTEFLTLIVGALLSVFLIPYFFQQWEANQKELEIKTDLVQSISESSVNSITSILLAEELTRGQVPLGEHDKDLVPEFLEWLIFSAKVKSELSAYFNNRDLDQKWNGYSVAMSDLFVLFEYNDTVKRREIIGMIYNNLATVTPGENTIPGENVTKGLSVRNNTDKYQNGWNELRLELLEKKDAIVNEILRTSISAYKFGIPIPGIR